MGALGCTYGVRTLHATIPRNTSLSYATIPLSSNYDLWVQLVGNLTTQANQKVHVRYRKLRQKVCKLILHRVFGGHAVDNPFFGIDFGSNRDGIFRSTVTNILHTKEEGIIPKFLSVFFGLMGDKQRAEVDALVETMFGNGQNRSSERQSYPRVSFTRDYTQLTRMSANEPQGQLFVLSVLLQMNAGRLVLQPRFAVDFDTKRAKARERMGGKPSNPACSGSSSDGDRGGNSNCSMPGPNNPGNDNSASSPAFDDNATVFDSQSESDDSSNRHNGDSLSDTLKDNLNRLDLSYLHEGIYPFLGEFHKNRFLGVLNKVLTKRSTSSIDRVAFPPRILDYRNVDRPTMLHQPNTTHVEKEHPNFEVTNARSSNSIKLPLEEFVYLVETLLSFIAFLKYGCGLLKSRPTGSVEYDKALELFLRMVVTTVERGESSNQWYLQKALEIVHFKQDILSFGPASGFSTETGERGLKSWAKQPSRTAQRRGDEIFSHQVCQRIHEAAILSAIDDSCPLEPTGIGVRDNQPDQYEALGSKFLMQFQPTPVIVRLLRSGKKHPIQIEFAKVIEAWFVGNFNTQVPIHIFLGSHIT